MIIAAIVVLLMLALGVTSMLLWLAFKGLKGLVRLAQRSLAKSQVKPQPF